MGRVKSGPSEMKLNQETKQIICRALRVGNYIEMACIMGGISRTTFYQWMRKGRNGTAEEFVDFSLSVEQANAEFEADALCGINMAGAVDWHAAAWMLERRFPKRWGKVRRYGKEVQDLLLQNLALRKLRDKRMD